MTPDEWLVAAKADADRRGLRGLKPLLDTLAEATRVLRNAVWNRHATAPPAGTGAPTSARHDPPR